VYRQG